MVSAARIKAPRATRTNGIAREIFANRQLMAAGAAQYRWRLDLRAQPDRRRVISHLSVTSMTRKPFVAAFEFDRDDVTLAAVMSAARFRIDIDAADFDTVNCSRHAGTRSLGQTRTSTEPMIQHAIITMKPVLNDPVR